MQKRLIMTLLAAAAAVSMPLSALPGGMWAQDAAAVSSEAEAGSGASQDPEGAADADQAAADKVAALIDAIYVQERTDTTDEDCAAARAAWDALTDEQKQLVEGENADPDYFGRDTGDASMDDPGNADGIGNRELLVVSFGTSFNDSRVKDIGGIEKALAAAYPDWSVRRAFTSQIIINHIQARDGEKIDNMDQALERASANGVTDLLIQPTHLMHGAEYDELVASVDAVRDKFASVSIAEPLLGEVGKDASVINDDKVAAAKAVTAAAVKEAGFGSLEEAASGKTAFVFMGHGTSHTANVTYSQMQTAMNDLSYDNVFIGTVEGKPADTACQAVIGKVKEAGYTHVILRPLMVVAGDHANNDMAGDDDDSWKSQFTAAGFESVDCQIGGLGELSDIQKIYVGHAGAAGAGKAAGAQTEAGTEAENAEITKPEDGTYTCTFTTDSGMFGVNEACEGKGLLTVRDGRMTVHISLKSESIVNLYPGLAEDAAKEGAELLQPTKDTIVYPDGLSETVNGFDVPVPAIGQEFDLALIGTKGKWYDHKVSVSGLEEGNHVPGLAPETEEDGENAQGGAAGDAASGSGQALGQALDAGSLADGSYTADVTLTGGSGKASVASPAVILVKDGKLTAKIQFSSANYDYAILDGTRYESDTSSGYSVFEIPIPGFDQEVPITADTTAMSKPHEIDYTLNFASATLKEAE